MILLVTALKNLQKTLAMNIITILQTAASLVMAAVMISAVSIAFHYYSPFEDYFEKNGLLVWFGAPSAYVGDITSEYDVLEEKEELLSYLDSSSEDMLSCHYLAAYMETGNSSDVINAISYDDEIIRRFQPDMEKGCWFHDENSSDEIEVVISNNDYGWNVGDVIDVSMLNEETTFTVHARVVGVIKEGARIIGLNTNGTKEENYLLFYQTYRYDVEKIPLLLFSKSALDKLSPRPQQGIYSSTLIRYNDDTSEETLKSDAQRLANMGAIRTISLTDLDKGSKGYIYRQLYNLMPIVGVLLVLVFVSSISSSALSAKRRMRDYALYYIVGLQWKQCIIVNFLQSIIICAISAVISIITLFSFQYSELRDVFRIEWNLWLFLTFVVILLLQLMASMLIPIQLLRHTTPKEILTNGGR